MGALIFAAGSKDLYFVLVFGATVGVISPSGRRFYVCICVFPCLAPVCLAHAFRTEWMTDLSTLFTGNEVGPFQTLEQSILSEQVDPSKRTSLFNVYNLVGYMATAVGQLAAGECSCQSFIATFTRWNERDVLF